MRVLPLREELPGAGRGALCLFNLGACPCGLAKGGLCSVGGRPCLSSTPHRRQAHPWRPSAPGSSLPPAHRLLRRCQNKQPEVPGCPEALPHSHPQQHPGGHHSQHLHPFPSPLLLKGRGFQLEPFLRKGRGWGNFPGWAPAFDSGNLDPITLLRGVRRPCFKKKKIVFLFFTFYFIGTSNNSA